MRNIKFSVPSSGMYIAHLNDVTKNLSDSEEQNDSSSIKLHVSSYINDSVIVVDYFTSYYSIVDIRGLFI